MSQNKTRLLHTINLEKYWPVLSPVLLSYLELERDEYFAYIPAEELEEYLTKAIQIGISAAKPYEKMQNITFLNEVLRSGLRIHFIKRHPTNSSIRAQYLRNKQTITIYKHSINEIQTFLLPTCNKIDSLDLILLHLCHEWFHHLEETKLGRTDLLLPKVVIKKRGPFLVKRSLFRLREIAAHAFTQTVLNLSWSPILLDQYRYHLEKGQTKAQIRERFQATSSIYYGIINK